MIKKKVIFEVSETVTVVGTIDLPTKDMKHPLGVCQTDLYRIFRSEPGGAYISVSTAYLSLFSDAVSKKVIARSKQMDDDTLQIDDLMRTVAKLLIKQANYILSDYKINDHD